MSTLLHLSQYQLPVNEYQKAVTKTANKLRYYTELKISKQRIYVKFGDIKNDTQYKTYTQH